MHDQADQLRRLVRDAVDQHGALAPGAPLIAVSGAHRGAGATTAACGLARELARLGKHVVLVDANLAAPAVAAAFNAAPAGTLADVLSGARRAIEVLVAPAENIRLLSGAAAQPGPLDNDALARLLAELAALCRQADVVLLDAGAGMNPWIDRLWQVAHHVLLVIAPTSAAAIDAYAAVKQSHSELTVAKVQLVVTRCDRPADAARYHAGFSDACQHFLGGVVKPPAVLPALDPLNDDPYRRSIRVLAADLACDFRALASRVPRNAPPGPSRGLPTPSAAPPPPGLRRGLSPY